MIIQNIINGVKDFFGIQHDNKEQLEEQSESLKQAITRAIEEYLDNGFKQVKTNLSTEKKKYTRLSSIAKIAIKQNKKLRNTLSNAIKIISLKNGVIKRLKQKTTEPVSKRNIANTNRIAI